MSQILVVWRDKAGRHSQECATADVARSVVKALRNDDSCIFAAARYLSGELLLAYIDGFDRT